MKPPSKRPLAGGAAPRKLSEELAALQLRFGDQRVTLREVIFTLRGSAYMLIVILLALPFITPIPLPGVSTPFGLAIGFIALRLALGQRPWLPKKLQRRELPPAFFRKVIAFAARVIALFESFLRPRLSALTGAAWIMQVHAFFILISAAVLLLPLPIPFSNSFPAWTILLLAAGMLERDGLFILLGYVVFVLGVLYFTLLGHATQEMMQAIHRWFVS